MTDEDEDPADVAGQYEDYLDDEAQEIYLRIVEDEGEPDGDEEAYAMFSRAKAKAREEAEEAEQERRYPEPGDYTGPWAGD